MDHWRPAQGAVILSNELLLSERAAIFERPTNRGVACCDVGPAHRNSGDGLGKVDDDHHRSLGVELNACRRSFTATHPSALQNHAENVVVSAVRPVDRQMDASGFALLASAVAPCVSGHGPP